MFNCQYLSDKNFKQKKETFPIKCYHFLGSNKSLTDRVIRLYYLYLCYIYIVDLFSSLKLHISILCTDQTYGPRIITDELSSSKSIDN